MLERFTREARETVEGAVAAAQDETASEVRPEHLLTSLLDHEACLAVQVLAGLGAPAATLRQELERRRLQYVDGLDADDAEALRAFGIDLDEVVRRIDRHVGGPASRRRRPRFSRAAKKVLELALREAIALRHNYIGTEHLLLGLARSDDRVVADTLAAVGVERGVLRQAVAEAVREAG
jgi:ATP-dependent Clp protease ATP-binding subunit ClpA